MTIALVHRPPFQWLLLCSWILFFSQALSADLSTQHILITEFSASNIETIADEDGDYSDWIEITNLSDERLNLRDYCITDSRLRPKKFRLPSFSLPPGERTLIFASGNQRSGFAPHFMLRLDSQAMASTWRL